MKYGVRLLEQAIYTIGERDREYGAITPLAVELAKRWSIALGVEISPQKAMLCLIDLKLARLSSNPAHTDSMVDVAGYIACLAEISQEVKHG